jgi:hypothetical protein
MFGWLLAMIRHIDAAHVEGSCDDRHYWQLQPCSPESQPHSSPQAQAIGTAWTGVTQLQA